MLEKISHITRLCYLLGSVEAEPCQMTQWGGTPYSSNRQHGTGLDTIIQSGSTFYPWRQDHKTKDHSRQPAHSLWHDILWIRGLSVDRRQDAVWLAMYFPNWCQRLVSSISYYSKHSHGRCYYNTNSKVIYRLQLRSKSLGETCGIQYPCYNPVHMIEIGASVEFPASSCWIKSWCTAIIEWRFEGSFLMASP